MSLIQKERELTKFDIDKLNEFLDPNSKENERIFKELVNDPILLQNRSYYDLTKPQLRELAAKKIQRLALYLENESFDTFNNRLSLLSIADPSIGTRIGINLALFVNAIKGNGTDDQVDYWLVKRGTLKIRDIYGCFAMTELGHGSNVANLQTTATYDPKTESFIINTPNLQATKWWIGGAAHSANHCVVYARLISNGKDYGVKTFVVQLRDSNFDLLPGVTIGDIGTKMGRDAIDNGWIQFTNVRIPREYMLQKFTQIEPDGTVSASPLEQISYSALLQGRVNMVIDSHRHGARFITIALRYAIGRKQFGDPTNENQIINYSLHQYRLIPYLSLIYVLGPGCVKLLNDYNTILADLYAAKNIKKTVSDLKDLFVNSASLKATNTWLVSQLIDEARQACGGHGYHAYSGLGRSFNDWSVQQTWEGDNNVLSINAGRSIIKYFKDSAIDGKKIGDDFRYLQFKLDDVNSLKFNDNLTDYINIWSLAIIKQCENCLKILKENKGDWESTSTERLLISKFHSTRYLLANFYEHLMDSNNLNSNEENVLILLFKLFSLFTIDKFSGVFLQFKLITSDKLSTIQQKMKTLLSEIRPHLVGLTDAFKYPDEIINSSLGCYNGDFYNNYFTDIINNYGRGDKAPYLDVLTSTLGRGDIDKRLSNSRTKQTLEKLGE